MSGKHSPQPVQPASSLDEFWQKFRLTPIEWEHRAITSAGWLSAITLGPIALLVALWTIYTWLYYKTSGEQFVINHAFADLRDPLFTYISLSLFFGALIFCFRWYPAIRLAFDSLIENDVLRTPDNTKITETELLDFLESYRRNLHSPKKYILLAVFMLVVLGVSFFTIISREFWDVSNLGEPLYLIAFLHIIPRWIIAPVMWAYLGTLWFWVLLTTTKAIMDLTPRFQINVQPLHSDRAGGLKGLGDLCSHVGLMIVVAITPAIVMSIQGTFISMQVTSCGNEMRLFTSGQETMSTDRLADCIYYVSSRYNAISRADIVDYLTTQLGNGITLENLASDFYSTNGHLFQRADFIANYSIFFVMDVALLAAIIYAFYVVFRPLFDIHNSMVEYKQSKEREINRQISILFTELTGLIETNKFEEADKVKANIKFLSDEMSEIQKYPRWPLSSLPVMRSYLTSSFITALVTYALSLLNLSISSEAGGVLNELIKSMFGQP